MLSAPSARARFMMWRLAAALSLARPYALIALTQSSLSAIGYDPSGMATPLDAALSRLSEVHDEVAVDWRPRTRARSSSVVTTTSRALASACAPAHRLEATCSGRRPWRRWTGREP